MNVNHSKWPEPQSQGEGGRPLRKGKLKIFLGYASGVGKTYAMLSAAQIQKDQGRDVAVGFLDSGCWPETEALAAGLERIPARKEPVREFDLDAALKRRPRLLLLDELSHVNAPGSRHRYRYQDVEEILRAGIDVSTTLDVQHLESLKDVVLTAAGISVEDRVPDHFFDLAFQVQLVDVDPEELFSRRREKRKRDPACQEPLFENRKNLAALREIALRRLAEWISRSSESIGKPLVPEAGEHLLICLSGAPSNEKVIRTAARMAEAFHSGFTALYVETPDSERMDEESRRRLRENRRLAEELGAKMATVFGGDVAAQIAEYAKVSRVSKIVIGRSAPSRHFFLPEKTLTDRLSQLAPDMDVYVIPNQKNSSQHRNRRLRMGERLSWKDLGKTLFLLLLVSLVGLGFYRAGFSEANMITVYLLGVLFVSIWTSTWIYGILASLASVLLFNFLFTVPRFSFRFYDASYPVTFLIMMSASLLASSLTMRVKGQAVLEARKAYRTEVLLETSQRLQEASQPETALQTMAEQMQKLLDRPVLFYLPGENKELEEPLIFRIKDRPFQSAYTGEEERAVALWVYRNDKHAGATTNTLSGAKLLYLSVRGQKSVLAVAGIVMEGYPEMDAFVKNLLLAMLDQYGLMLDKISSDREKQKAESRAQQEALRANLLRAISHDLRTPLTSISGNADILIRNSKMLDEEKKQAIYANINDDAIWLVNLVENLLAVTRIENGAMAIHMEPELMDEIFHEALHHLDRNISEHQLSVELSDDLLMAQMDARLIVQVLINLINNAVKYTPAGSHIQLKAEKKEDWVLVQVADDGQGIPDEAKLKIFDMFYTANNDWGDGRRSLGLGLALCKSIVTSHGGKIGVKDHFPHGAVFYFTLQSAEVEL